MKPSLKVIHSTPVWLPQTQTWMYQQIARLPEWVESHVVCERTEHLDQFALPHIHSLEQAAPVRQRWDRLMLQLRLRRHLGLLVSVACKHHVPLLHSNFGNIGWANRGAVRAAKLKHVVSFYGLDVNYLPQQNRKWFKHYRNLFREVDRILCEGPHMARCIVALGCPEEKIRVHHLGVDLESLPYRPRTRQEGEPLRILLAASFQEKKGLPYALEALGRLQHELPIEVTVIGDARNEPRSLAEKQRILEVISRTRLGEKVRLLGYQPHATMHAEAERHHLFLSPSVTASDGDTEGGAPVSLIEMAASGMLLVSTTHADIPSVIRHEETGLLAPERDVDALVTHLRYLAKHPERWPAMLDAGRRHIEAHYDAKKQGLALAERYQELLQ